MQPSTGVESIRALRRRMLREARELVRMRGCGASSEAIEDKQLSLRQFARRVGAECQAADPRTRLP